uniref:Homologous recombination factor with OB-fold n=1 Tax=Cyclopterus lumpus TaxID=8103 RepID=A0A8C2ZFH3_CYCLU
QTCNLRGLFSIGEDFDDEVNHSRKTHLMLRNCQCGLLPGRPSSCHPSLTVCVCFLPSFLPSFLPRTCSGQTGLPAHRLDLLPCRPARCGLPLSLSEGRRQTAFIPPASSSKTLRPPTCGGVQTHPDRPLRDFGTARQASGSFGHNLPSRASSTPLLRSPNPRPAYLSAPPQSPGVFPGLSASSPGPSPISKTIARPQRPWATPGPSPRGHVLFETVSPAPSSSPSLSPHPRHTPVFTNRLVQLVSASNKLPNNKRPRSEPHRTRTRRFPGPAGFLPQQPQGQNLDDIVVSVPQTPAHGVVARSPSQVTTADSQTDEDEFGGGGWAAMKAEMGLDERNPSCFLHSYSVVMVLRKAALKQLAKNKVPNMAVLLKSIIHTHADAKAVFKDPTGEIQGTVHRRLLEDRAEELKVGSVLLLKQVGVFSPSHRNHYLNVTPNNLLRIYAPDGVGLSSTRLPPLVLVSDRLLETRIDTVQQI